MAKHRNLIAEVIPWIAVLVPCLYGGFKINELNTRAETQEHQLNVMFDALSEIKLATSNDEWTPSQKAHSIEQVLAVTEREVCKVKVE